MRAIYEADRLDLVFKKVNVSCAERITVFPQRPGGYTFRSFKVEFRVLTEKLQFVKLGLEVVKCASGNAYIVGVSMIVICDVGVVRSARLVGRFKSSAASREPA